MCDFLVFSAAKEGDSTPGGGRSTAFVGYLQRLQHKRHLAVLDIAAADLGKNEMAAAYYASQSAAVSGAADLWLNKDCVLRKDFRRKAHMGDEHRSFV